ncbi:MAG: hypothetical protein IIY21_18660 [Clostridiales bacterium]|nr:hypothetical protein [Clostridiales bacterium]
MATEIVGIELQLMGAEGVKRDLEHLDKLLNSFRGKKQFDAGFDEARRRVLQYRGELLKLQKVQKNLASKGLKSEGLNNKIESVKQKLREAQQAVREFGQASRSAGQTFMQTFNSISSKVAHVGSAMQSLGNAMVRLTSPFRKMTTGLLMGAGYKAFNLFTEGLGNAFQRADTMKNYDRALKALGLDVAKTFSVAGKEAKTAKENLDDAVQGLPTSLDEIMAAQKVYAGATGEMVESTKTAIAANNTFLASGMGAREQRFLQKYLVAMASGAELTTVQWQSMARIAPLAMRAVSKELGYASDEYAQFNKDVQNGTLSGKEFLKAFQKVGVSGVVADAARAQTESWNGLFSNIRIAVTRMGANVLDTINQTFKKATGRTLLQRLLGWDAEGKDLQDGIKSWINGISESVQNWIKANPDRIVEFFDNLKSIDFKGLLRGLAEGALEFARLVGAFAKWASNKDLSKLGRWMPRLNIIGNALLVFGGFLKGTRHIWALLGAGGKYLAGKLPKFGILDRIMALFGSKKSIDEAKEIPTIANTFKSAFGALEGLIKAAGAITLVAGTGFVAFKAAKSILSDLKDMVDLVNGGGWDNVGYVASGVIVGIGAFTEIFNAIGTALGPQGLLATAIAGAASFIVAGSFAADMWAIKQGVIQIRDTITELDNVATEITNFKGIGTLSAGVKQRFADTIASINEIKDMFVGKSGSKKDRGQVQAGLPTFGASSVTAITNIINTLKGLQKFASKLNDIAGITINQNASSKVEEIGKAITAMTKAMPNAMKNGNTSYGHMSTNISTLTQAFKQMSTMTKRINKLAGTDVNTSGFSAFVESIRTALEDFKSLSGELMLDIEVKLSPMFGSSVAAVKKNIQNAKKEIEKYKAPISYNIPVNITFSVSTNAWSAIAQIREARARVKHAKEGQMEQTYEAKGGLIYRAHGGGVPWKRRGTDTVPAMLTPGEYVQNKRAVSAFGIDFMRKVNNLDMKGAMNELMHRAGHMANINRGATITNNNYNNQKVVINNSNAGAGYTFKTASRFVGAF